MDARGSRIGREHTEGAAPGLPVRGDGSVRLTSLPVPPQRMALWRGGRPLKRWRYIGGYGPELMLCALSVRLGGVPQAGWAAWDRAAGVPRERTVFVPGAVDVSDRVRFGGRGVE